MSQLIGWKPGCFQEYQKFTNEHGEAKYRTWVTFSLILILFIYTCIRVYISIKFRQPLVKDIARISLLLSIGLLAIEFGTSGISINTFAKENTCADEVLTSANISIVCFCLLAVLFIGLFVHRTMKILKHKPVMFDY
jgi:hypothetical protein